MDSETESSLHNGTYDSKTKNEDRQFLTKMDSSYVVKECLKARTWTDVFGKGEKSLLDLCQRQIIIIMIIIMFYVNDIEI